MDSCLFMAQRQNKGKDMVPPKMKKQYIPAKVHEVAACREGNSFQALLSRVSAALREMFSDRAFALVDTPSSTIPHPH